MFDFIAAIAISIISMVVVLDVREDVKSTKCRIDKLEKHKYEETIIVADDMYEEGN